MNQFPKSIFDSITMAAEQNQHHLAESIFNAGNANCLRSGIFNFEHGTISLISAAAPLFTLVTKLQKAKEITVDKSSLFQSISHEIMVFTKRAQTFSLRSQQVASASYVLCALTDETIGNTAFGEACNWREDSLTKYFHGEDFCGERFFVLLDQAYQEPAHNIDLLELFYFCLSLGYRGKFKEDSNGLLYIARIKDILYDNILKLRGEPKKNTLFVTNETNIVLGEKRKIGLRWQLVMISGLLVFGLTALLFYFISQMK